MLNPGTMLGDRYEILDKIGTGGMADVYKAKCHKLNRYVAIKVLKAEFATNKSFVSKFRAEAQAAAGLIHPNIVNVYDVGDENGMYYFVMELVEGITLKKYIEKKIRLSVKEAVSIAIQIAMGIESAHNNGIIHRDIKPQNIIISKEGKVKVADFGIARAASSDTQTSHAMGSVHYTSPEQARGGYSDAKSDIYSIGITLFEMVTGRVPFDGETTVAIAIKHIQEEMPSPRIYVSEIPISVEQIIFKCTQKHPDSRYVNVSDLIQDLKDSLLRPNDNFVVIRNPASADGTKTITEADRMEIRQQTSSNMYAQGGYEQVQYASNMYNEGANGYNQPYATPYYGNQNGANTNYNNGYQNGYNQNGYGNMYQDAYDKNAYENGQYNGQNYNAFYENTNEQGEEFEDPYSVMNPRNIQKRSESKSKKTQAGKSDALETKKKQIKERQDQYVGNVKKKPVNTKRDYVEEDDDEVDPKMDKIMTILMISAAVILALVVIFIVGKVTGQFGSGDTEVEEGVIYVPNLVGLSLTEATAALKDVGLKATASYVDSAEFGKDIICSQNPTAGTQADEETELLLTVSNGKLEVEQSDALTSETTTEDVPVGGAPVPDVVGKSEAEARVAIENEGFVFTALEQASDTVEKGKVISQSPLGATTAKIGSSVQVYISIGKDTQEVKVPDLTGKDEAGAKAALTEAGLKLGTVTEEESAAAEKGKVISQSTSAGTTVEEGDTVDIKISKGKPGYTCNCTVQSPADYLVGSEAVIVLLDSNSAEIQRFSTSVFPYTVVKTGITTSSSGIITVTYQTSDGQWQTSAPSPVNFSKE